MSRSSRSLIILLTAFALLCAAVAAQARTWNRLSPPQQSNTSQISVLRNADGSMTVGGMFKSATTWGADVLAIPVGKNGPVGAATVAASGNAYTILTSPAVIRQGERSLLVFGGANGSFDGLVQYDLATAAATPLTASGTGPTYGAGFASAAATAAGGLASWSTSAGLTGFSLTNGAPAQALPITGCCAYNSNIAVTPAGAAWVAYDSNETGATGRWVQRVDPATGAAVGGRTKVPRSSVGGNYSFPVESRVPLAVAGSGVYTAWAQGYPSTTRIALWKVGGGQPRLWTPGYNVAAVGVAATPSGALWLFWADAGTGTIRAMRSNNARSVWSTPITVGKPFRTAETVYKMVGDASRSDGKLNLFTASATAAGSPTWYHTVVAP